MKHYFFITLIALSMLLGFFGCQLTEKKVTPEDYVKSIKEWQQKRLTNLKSENGWLNLVGLYWLKDGQNPFGSSEANNIIFPKNAPEFIGTIILYKGNISVSINADVNVYINDSLFKEYDILTDNDENTTQFKLGTLRWHIIKRGDRYGIRLRDLESPLINQIAEIPSFPIDLNWRIEAKFERFQESKEIAIPNVLGETSFEKYYGVLKFTIEGKEYSLIPTGDGINEDFFVIFADETSAEETYGAGRFLSVEKPDKNGNTFIDFNKATNPPCAFTNFATCPLPPKENILDVKILAGEKIDDHFGRH
ncbi:MAG: hypothetical protein A2W99_06330 [Bacteroidetes bacterium GWF2_33_16]|nr:MAG: hypothetical protein A2X00_12565 [Bacteroidetes bacterium GWE2_32_14]OFY05296.1 MAG: hypothetical protein A2W99_06330 [Bacteroidetes bacterium GWF2_33_16]